MVVWYTSSYTKEKSRSLYQFVPSWWRSMKDGIVHQPVWTHTHAWHPTFDTHTCRMRPLLSEWGHGTGHLSGKCIFSMKWTSSALCPSEQICSLNVEEQSSTPCNVSAWGGRKAGRFTTQMAPRGYHKPPTISPGLIFFRKRFLMGLYNNNNNNNNLFPAYLQSIAIHLDPKLY
jgi:hypothetical protein